VTPGSSGANVLTGHTSLLIHCSPVAAGPTSKRRLGEIAHAGPRNAAMRNLAPAASQGGPFQASASGSQWHAKAAIWQTEANRWSASPTYEASDEPRRQAIGAGQRAQRSKSELVVEDTTSVDEMITCLGSCRARSEIAAMVKALSLHPRLNTPAETKRLEAARAAMENWKSYSRACQARHYAHRLRLGDR
jgi:hypothetical protein